MPIFCLIVNSSLTLTIQMEICGNKTLEFFTISPQYKNANMTNFILAVPLKIRKTYKVCKLDI